jgi:hypothetical protein
MEHELYMSRLRKALKASKAARDGDWAHAVCKLSRRIQEAVHNSRPDRGFVGKEVVPLLREAAAAVDKVPRKGPHKDKIDRYRNNISDRADDMQDYADGRLSSFAPRKFREKVENSTAPADQLLDEMLREIGSKR